MCALMFFQISFKSSAIETTSVKFLTSKASLMMMQIQTFVPPPPHIPFQTEFDGGCSGQDISAIWESTSTWAQRMKTQNIDVF